MPQEEKKAVSPSEVKQEARENLAEASTESKVDIAENATAETEPTTQVSGGDSKMIGKEENMNEDRTQNKEGREKSEENEGVEASESEIKQEAKENLAEASTESKVDISWNATSETEPTTQVSGGDSKTGGKAALVIASLGLLIGIVALFGLILKPDYKNQINSLVSEMYGISKSVQSSKDEIKEVGNLLDGLENRFGDFEKTITVIELRKMLDILKNVSQNIPESALQRTELIQENIRSILADLGSKGPVIEEAPQDISKEAEPVETTEEWGDYKVIIPGEWKKTEPTQAAEEWGDYKVIIPEEWKKTEPAQAAEEWGDYKVIIPGEWKKTSKEAEISGEESETSIEGKKDVGEIELYLAK